MFSLGLNPPAAGFQSYNLPAEVIWLPERGRKWRKGQTEGLTRSRGMSLRPEVEPAELPGRSGGKAQETEHRDRAAVEKQMPRLGERAVKPVERLGRETAGESGQSSGHPRPKR